MEAQHFDVAVVGLGGMGCASVYHLCKAGLRVIAFDSLPQKSVRRASTTNRGVRHAYFDDDRHVRLALDATQGFLALQQRVGTTLLWQSSGVLIGNRTHPVMEGVAASAKRHELPMTHLTPQMLGRHFPKLHFDPSMEGLVEENAGYVNADEVNAAFLSLAEKATVHFETTVDVDQGGRSVRIRTNRGKFTCDRVVWCTGAWLSKRTTLSLKRQFQLVLPTSQEIPLFNVVKRDSTSSFYAIPNPDGRVVVGQHHGGRPCALMDAFNPPKSGELDALREFAFKTFATKLEQTEARVGIYANTNSRTGFVCLDEEDERFVLCGGFSGHGYKFVPEVGASVVSLVTGRDSKDAYSLWRKRDRTIHVAG